MPTQAELDSARDYIAKRGAFYARLAHNARIKARLQRDIKHTRGGDPFGSIEAGARQIDRQAREHEASVRAMADSLITGGILHA